MKKTIISIFLGLISIYCVISILHSPITWMLLAAYFDEAKEVNANKRPFGKYFKGKVYEISRDLIMVKDDGTRMVYMVNRYQDLNGEVFPMSCDTHQTTWKRVPKGTQFTIKEVKVMRNKLGNEKERPIFYAEFKEPFNESTNDLVKVSWLFSFDFDHLYKEENKSRDRDIVISECVKPDPKLMREVERP